MLEHVADLAAGFLVGIEPRAHEDEIGAEPLRGDRGHGAPHPELARLVARRGHNPAPARPADRHGKPAQFGIVALFDAGEEGIHVDMDDLPEAQLVSGSLLAMLVGRRVACHAGDK